MILPTSLSPLLIAQDGEGPYDNQEIHEEVEMGFCQEGHCGW